MTKLPLDVDWTHWIATPPVHTQKQIMRDVYSQTHNELLGTLTPAQRAATRSAGGTGAAAWMYPPADATTHMLRKHYLTALRYRAHAPISYTTTSNLCQHTNTKRKCLHPPDPQGHHALTCQIGGQPTQKHNHLRDILYNWLVSWGFFCQREQRVPELDDTNADGTPRHAILDIYTTINDRQYLIDISVTDAVSAQDIPPPTHDTTPQPPTHANQTNASATTTTHN